MIHWNKADLEEFFGVDAKFYDPAHSYSFELSRDGLRMLVTLFDFEGAVYVSIWREGLPKPLFTIAREACTHALVGHDTGQNCCLQVGSSSSLTTNMGIPPVLERGIRIYVEPQFRVEFIDVEKRGDGPKLGI